ncbi:MAG: hypothetical protein II839_11160, partial [Kiritimatiellae bacterium]|nr:hypothetical protein [Kiritimatiellia bacterium]
RRCTACGFVLGVPRFAGEGAVRFDGTDGPRLRVRIADATAGAWYTAFSAESLDGPFLAEAASVYARTAGELAFDIDATPAAKFVVVAASSAPFDAGDALPR